jgi:hypothetical protein
MIYHITTEIFDKDDKSIEKKTITQNSDDFLTVAELKEFGGKSNYEDIDTDDFMHHGQGQPDNELVKQPFIYYKIKLK